MVKSNFITSIYGKDNIDKFIYKAIRNGASVHVNEKELVRLNSLSTHRLRGALLSLLKRYHTRHKTRKLKVPRFVIVNSARDRDMGDVVGDG